MVFRNVVGVRIKLFYYLYSFRSICKIHLFYIKIGLSHDFETLLEVKALGEVLR